MIKIYLPIIIYFVTRGRYFVQIISEIHSNLQSFDRYLLLMFPYDDSISLYVFTKRYHEILLRCVIIIEKP